MAEAVMTNRMTNRGTVDFFNVQKSYGFIQPDAGGEEVFVHITVVMDAGLRTLHKGQRVDYTTVLDPQSGKIWANEIEILG